MANDNRKSEGVITSPPATCSTTPWTISLAVCMVLEVLIWWKLNWSSWAFLLGFIAGCRGSFLTRRRQAKESPNEKLRDRTPNT